MNDQPDNPRASVAIHAVVSSIVTVAGGQPDNWRALRTAVVIKLAPELAALHAKLQAFFEAQQEVKS